MEKKSSYSVNFQHLYIVEWHVVTRASMNTYQKDIFYRILDYVLKKSPQSMTIILDSTFNILWEKSMGGRRLYNHSTNT